MTVDETIAKISGESDLKPLIQFLEKGRGFALEEFCSNTKFTPPKLTHESLLWLVRGHAGSSPRGADPPEALKARLNKATGPILASVIKELGGVPAGKPADRKRQLTHFLIHREFPAVAKKKAAPKRALPKLDPEAVITEFALLKQRARTLSVDEIDRTFQEIFKKKGCTIPVIRAVLKAESLDASGTKAVLLDRLRRIPRTLAGDRARESFA